MYSHCLIHSTHWTTNHRAILGSLRYFDKAFDRITTKTERKLPALQNEKVQNNPTSSEDPFMASLKDLHKTQLFATDSVLAALMCCTKSIYSWDIIITKQGNHMWLDKRTGGPLDFVTVNENATEPPVDTTEFNLNAPHSLAFEATHVDSSYSQFATNQVIVILRIEGNG